MYNDHFSAACSTLSKACGLSIPALSQVKNDKRAPSVDLLLRLSKIPIKVLSHPPSGNPWGRLPDPISTG
jgi:transcriptional regulator with XRE-family HTH domain